MQRVFVLLTAGALAGACARGGGPAPAAPAAAGLTMRLTSVPAVTTGRPVYVAGTFNNWNPGAPAFRLTAAEGGQYLITLPDSVRGRVEFKFTLGSWERVELAAGGADQPNRVFDIPASGPATWNGAVAAWRDSATARRERPPRGPVCR